jgi:hypothetical protein
MVHLPGLTIPGAAAPERAGWIEPELALWLAVLERGIADACNQARVPAEIEIREQARLWLTEPSGGLHTILLLVDIEPDWWHRQAVPALRRRWETPGRTRGARWRAIPTPAAM